MPPRRLFRWSSGLILLSLVVDPGRAFQASPLAPPQLTARKIFNGSWIFCTLLHSGAGRMAEPPGAECRELR